MWTPCSLNFSQTASPQPHLPIKQAQQSLTISPRSKSITPRATRTRITHWTMKVFAVEGDRVPIILELTRMMWMRWREVARLATILRKIILMTKSMKTRRTWPTRTRSSETCARKVSRNRSQSRAVGQRGLTRMVMTAMMRQTLITRNICTRQLLVIGLPLSRPIWLNCILSLSNFKQAILWG